MYTLFEMTLIAALAVYRLTMMLNQEAGPGHIFTRFRSAIGVKFDEYSNPYGTNWVAEGVLCFFCLSVWIGIAVTAMMVIFYQARQIEYGIVILLPFALSGLAVFMKKWTG